MDVFNRRLHPTPFFVYEMSMKSFLVRWSADEAEAAAVFFPSSSSSSYFLVPPPFLFLLLHSSVRHTTSGVEQKNLCV